MRSSWSRTTAVVLGGALLVPLGACAPGGATFCETAQAYQDALEQSGATFTRAQAADAFAQVEEDMRRVSAPEGLGDDWDRVTATAADVAAALDGDGDETALLLDADYRDSVAAVRDYVDTTCDPTP